MANLLTPIEIAGARDDFAHALGLVPWVRGDQVDTEVTIFRTNAQTLGPINPETLQYDEPLTDIIYSGPSHFAPMAHRRDRQEIAGGETQRIRQYVAIVPWDAGDIHLDDTYRIDKCSDPYAVGKSFIITDVRYTSVLEARVLTLTDVGRDVDECNDPDADPD